MPPPQLLLDLQGIVPFFDVELPAENLENRSIGNRASVGNAVAFEPIDLVTMDRRVKLVEKARLSEPGLPHDANDLPMAGLDASEAIVQEGPAHVDGRELRQPAGSAHLEPAPPRWRPVTR